MTKKMQKYIAFQGNFSCTIQKKIVPLHPEEHTVLS